MIEAYSEAIRDKPDSGGAYFYRGVARATIGDLDGAIDDFTASIRLNPNNPDSY